MSGGGGNKVKSLETRDGGSGKIMFPEVLGMARLSRIISGGGSKTRVS